MSDPQQSPPSEEELRAAYEQQLKQLRVEDIVVQTIVSLVNLGGRKAGLAAGTEEERDPEQLRMAIEAVRSLLPLVESALGPDAAAIREALSQLQMAYSQAGGAAGEGPAGRGPAACRRTEPGPPFGPRPGAVERPYLGSRAVTRLTLARSALPGR
jgi:hypothetical protein